VAVLNPSFAVGLRSKAYVPPPEVDWIGFDEYGCWNASFPRNNHKASGASRCYKGVWYPDLLHGVDDYARRYGKKFVVVPDAHYGTRSDRTAVPNTTIQRDMASMVELLYEYCARSPRCVAMFPFLWNTVPGCCSGAATMATLRPALERIGLAIKRRSGPARGV
jgi:hypothetical protein